VISLAWVAMAPLNSDGGISMNVDPFNPACHVTTAS
jgi:hypothetical protein